MNKTQRFASLILLVTLAIQPTVVNATQHNGGISYVSWNSMTLSNKTAISYTIQPKYTPDKTYWSTYWKWDNAELGAYAGIQTLGNYSNKEISDLAIFSIWNSTSYIPGPDSNCLIFGNEGYGASCRVKIDVSENNNYTINVSMDKKIGRDWWKATIFHHETNTQKTIGWIKATHKNLYSTNFMSFIEYWGPAVSCDSVPKADAKFFYPKSHRKIKPNLIGFFKSPIACVNSSMYVDLDNNPVIVFGNK